MANIYDYYIRLYRRAPGDSEDLGIDTFYPSNFLKDEHLEDRFSECILSAIKVDMFHQEKLEDLDAQIEKLQERKRDMVHDDYWYP